MTEDREPLGRIAHAIYRDWLAEQVRRVYGDEVQMGSWEDLAEGMREAYMRMGSAVAAAERERIATHMDALAGASGGSSHFAYRNAAHEIRKGQSAPEETQP